MTPPVAITGIGCVSPAGIGGRDAALALAKGPAENHGFQVPEFPLEDFLENARSFRRVANSTKFCLAAVALALRDAGLPQVRPDGARTGVVIGVTHGALAFSAQFHGGLLRDGPEAASPMLFAESVLNAAAGNVAIAFGVRGPVHTLIGEETVGAQAIGTALGLLRLGVVDRCVVAATEERSDLIENAYRQMDRAASRSTPEEDPPPPTGEGAAALVVEQQEAAVRRGARFPVPVLSVRCSRDGQGEMSDSVAGVVKEELASLGKRGEEIRHVVVPTGRNRGPVTRGALRALGQRGAGTPRFDIAPRVGNPFCAAVLLQASLSAALLSTGDAPGAGLVLASGISRTFSVVLLGESPWGRTDIPGE